MEGGKRSFMRLKFEDRALHVIASDELYRELGVKEEARVFFSSAHLHQRWLDTMDAHKNDSVEGYLQTIMEQVMLQKQPAALQERMVRTVTQ